MSMPVILPNLFLKKGCVDLPEPLSGFERHLSFLNDLKLPTQFVAIIRLEEHSSQTMGGWEGIASLTCLGEDEELYDIDVRYACGSGIFKQNLFDFGWSEATLLHKKLPHEPPRNKLIIYLCEASTGLQISQKSDSVPERFAIGRYWQTIHHFYLLLPLEHPFVLPPMRSNTTQFGDYATTRCLTTEKPTFVNEVDNRISSLLFLPPHSLRQGEGGLRTQGLFKKIDKNERIISVITVVFNGDKYLEQTIQSVINQSADLEYLIIDGGSTDGTLDIIKKYDNQIDYWVSEPDEGIYDAMNKGTISALGTHTLHINGDDLIFQPNSVPNHLKESNQLRGIFTLLEDGVISKRVPEDFDVSYHVNLIEIPLSHQGFIGIKNNRSLFENRYKLIADRIVMCSKIQQEETDVFAEIVAMRRAGGVISEVHSGVIEEIRVAVASCRDIKVRFRLIKLEIYCRLRKIAKLMGLVKLKRKYWR